MNRQNTTHSSQRWTSKSLASSFFHKIFYAVIQISGRNIAYLMLFFVVIFYCMIPKIRKRASYYIRLRFPKCSQIELFAHTFRLYWNFGKMLVDRSVFRILNDFKAQSEEKHKDELATLYAKHERLILITGHVGCWQMGISFLDFLKGPKAVVMIMDSGNVDQHSFKWKTPSAKNDSETNECITIINPAAPLGGTLEMLNALNNRSILCINADRVLGSEKHTVKVTFLGQRIRLPISPYKLAAATRTPIAIVFSERNGAGAGNFYLAKTLHVPPDADKGEIRGAEAFKPYAQAYANELERYCVDNPYQFYNFFNMWQ